MISLYMSLKKSRFFGVKVGFRFKGILEFRAPFLETPSRGLGPLPGPIGRRSPGTEQKAFRLPKPLDP